MLGQIRPTHPLTIGDFGHRVTVKTGHGRTQSAATKQN